MSDAVLVMVQFEGALESFSNRYHQYISFKKGHVWITKEQLAEWEEEEVEDVR